MTDKEKFKYMRNMVIRLNKIKKADLAKTSNWEVDRYYEDNLKKYDTE